MLRAFPLDRMPIDDLLRRVGNPVGARIRRRGQHLASGQERGSRVVQQHAVATHEERLADHLLGKSAQGEAGARDIAHLRVKLGGDFELGLTAKDGTGDAQGDPLGSSRGATATDVGRVLGIQAHAFWAVASNVSQPISRQ